ncbi:MAG TPA: heavy metal translocating P-type ATPase [Bryobacteraceae bacterium]|nr:heavy metal translocating P-type ATPase [Bryobacteraceae bacterium]
MNGARATDTKVNIISGWPTQNSEQAESAFKNSLWGERLELLARRYTYSKEIWIAIVAAVGLALNLVFRYTAPHAPYGRWSLAAVLLAGGALLVVELAKKALAGEFGSDLLAGLSIITSALIGEYLAGSIVVLMLSGGTALEQYATRRASAALSALAKRLPSIAHRRAGSQLADISLEDVQVGDVLVLLPHEICPVDGVVQEGRGTMDESYLTGEPYLLSKTVGSEVLSGAVNGDAALVITATRLPQDSRYTRIMQVMREAESNRPRLRRIADRLGAWYTVLAIAMAAVGWIAGHDVTRFLAVLVIATPCPLLLAIPIAIIGAISAAASRGIIIKNPAMLENVSRCRTMIFDKTGTLTYGRPALIDVMCGPGISDSRALQLAASVEKYSRHPLAQAIIERARQESIALVAATAISEKPGQGLTAHVEGTLVQITGRKQVEQKSPGLASALPSPVSGMECILLIGGQYGATFRFRDAPRAESRSFIHHLFPKHHVSRLMLLSGDRESEVRYLAHEVGITEVRYGMGPEEKVAIVREEASRAPTLFMGDGINDAPAMQAATVGVAFGQNSDITAEAADAVVMESSLKKVDELIHIGRRMRRISLESAVGGMTLSLIGMVIAAAGYLPPVVGAVAQEVIDLAAVLNALRIVLPGGDLLPDG